MSEPSTLLLRLAGVTQGWNTRRTPTDPRAPHGTLAAEQLAPTHSGVVGLMACALGRPRGADMDDLIDLDIVVRTDQLGHARTEFRTTRRPNTLGRVRTVPEREHVLDDAIFLVGVSGDPALLADVAWALEHPRWALGLGKREFPPLLPLMLGIHADTPAETALRDHEWLAAHWYRPSQPRTARLNLHRPLRLPARYWHDYPRNSGTDEGYERYLDPVLVDNPAGTRGFDWLSALDTPAPAPTSPPLI